MSYSLNWSNRLVREARWRISSKRRIAGWLEKRLALSNSRWLFLLGVNNSGTTLLNRVLESHPQISGMHPEGQNITRAYPHPAELGVARVWSEREGLFHWTEEDDPAPALRALYDWSYFLTPGQILLEKSPTNTMRTRWLQRNFAPASFLSIVRHPYAVCEGIRRRAGHSIERACRHWVRAHQILLEDLPHLERAKLVRYEDFCDRPVESLHEIQSFLGLTQPFDPSLLSTEFNIHNVDNTGLKIENLNPKSVARLSEDEIRRIDELAGPTMSELGYEVASRDLPAAHAAG